MSEQGEQRGNSEKYAEPVSPAGIGPVNGAGEELRDDLAEALAVSSAVPGIGRDDDDPAGGDASPRPVAGAPSEYVGFDDGPHHSTGRTASPSSPPAEDRGGS